MVDIKVPSGFLTLSHQVTPAGDGAQWLIGREKSIARRVLLKGETGSGKTLTCAMMVKAWMDAEPQGAHIHIAPSKIVHNDQTQPVFRAVFGDQRVVVVGSINDLGDAPISGFTYLVSAEIVGKLRNRPDKLGFFASDTPTVVSIDEAGQILHDSDSYLKTMLRQIDASTPQKHKYRIPSLVEMSAVNLSEDSRVFSREKARRFEMDKHEFFASGLAKKFYVINPGMMDYKPRKGQGNVREWVALTDLMVKHVKAAMTMKRVWLRENRKTLGCKEFGLPLGVIIVNSKTERRRVLKHLAEAHGFSVENGTVATMGDDGKNAENIRSAQSKVVFLVGGYDIAAGIDIPRTLAVGNFFVGNNVSLSMMVQLFGRALRAENGMSTGVEILDTVAVFGPGWKDVMNDRDVLTFISSGSEDACGGNTMTITSEGRKTLESVMLYSLYSTRIGRDPFTPEEYREMINRALERFMSMVRQMEPVFSSPLPPRSVVMDETDVCPIENVYNKNVQFDGEGRAFESDPEKARDYLNVIAKNVIVATNHGAGDDGENANYVNARNFVSHLVASLLHEAGTQINRYGGRRVSLMSPWVQAIHANYTYAKGNQKSGGVRVFKLKDTNSDFSDHASASILRLLLNNTQVVKAVVGAAAGQMHGFVALDQFFAPTSYAISRDKVSKKKMMRSTVVGREPQMVLTHDPLLKRLSGMRPKAGDSSASYIDAGNEHSVRVQKAIAHALRVSKVYDAVPGSMVQNDIKSLQGGGGKFVMNMRGVYPRGRSHKPYFPDLVLSMVPCALTDGSGCAKRIPAVFEIKGVGTDNPYANVAMVAVSLSIMSQAYNVPMGVIFEDANGNMMVYVAKKSKASSLYRYYLMSVPLDKFINRNWEPVEGESALHEEYLKVRQTLDVKHASSLVCQRESI